MTDSDNSKGTDSPPDYLDYYGLIYSDNAQKWYLQDFYGSNDWYIAEVHGLAQMPHAPIPSAVWLLGSGLIGLAGLKKKFRK